jgi:hypothetical protein
MDIMATELNTTEFSIDEEIDQIANEIATEIENEMSEATGEAPESGKVTKAATPKGNKLTKKKVKAEVKTKGQGSDPAEIEVYEAADEDEEEGGNPFAKKGKKGKKGKNPFAKKGDDDEEEDDEEDVEEQALPETKQEIIRAVFETMKNTDPDKLAGAYAKLMDDLLGESVSDEDEESEETSSSIERKVFTSEDIDISEDLDAIFGDSSDDLSEGFKTQVQTVFEAAVVAKINSELDIIENTFVSKLSESKDEILSTLTDKVDNYLSYVVEEWVNENELAIDRGIKAEITEDFIGGLKQLFEDHYVDIPEEKVDVVDSLADRVDQLETELNETLEKSIGMASQIKSFQKGDVLGELADGLTDIEAEKLKELSEGVGFENVEQYKTSLETIKENYFPRTSSAPHIDEDSEILLDGNERADAPKSSQMSAYVDAIGQSVLEN